MGKRTPLTPNRTDVCYVFLSSARIVLKIKGIPDGSHKWFGSRLNIRILKAHISIASYSGSRDIIYFPASARTHELLGFDCFFSNQRECTCDVTLDGVLGVRKPVIPDSFDDNDSTLSVLRHFHIPPPVDIRVYWKKTPIGGVDYQCSLNCKEGAGHLERRRKSSDIDEFLEAFL